MAFDPVEDKPASSRLPSTARASIIEALASAVVEDYLAEQQQLTKTMGDSPAGHARRERDHGLRGQLASRPRELAQRRRTGGSLA